MDNYTWVDVGSSYLPSELNAAYLYAQLEIAEEINENRLKSWKAYQEALLLLRDRGLIELPVIPGGCIHNAHMFYIKVKDIEQRTKLIQFLKEHGIETAFHYVPLHSSSAGKRQGVFYGLPENVPAEAAGILKSFLYR